MIQIKPLDTFYIHSYFKPHLLVKDNLIKLINESDGKEIIEKEANTHIKKSDWYRSRDNERPWVQYILPYLEPHFKECFLKAGYNSYTIQNLWYQQYKENNEHGWHIHGENFTGVYYVDLPDIEYSTEYLNPLDNKQLKKFKVNTGDLIIFPSYIIHRAPKIKSKLFKTILSFNINIGYPDNTYDHSFDK